LPFICGFISQLCAEDTDIGNTASYCEIGGSHGSDYEEYYVIIICLGRIRKANAEKMFGLKTNALDDQF
jgi:hypothetical protein